MKVNLLGENKLQFLHEFFMQEAVVTARFSAISTGSMVNGVWYKPVEQFILPKVSFSHILGAVARRSSNRHPPLQRKESL